MTRELIISGDAPKLAGWTFQARLTWDEDVLVTRCTPGFEGRIDDSRSARARAITAAGPRPQGLLPPGNDDGRTCPGRVKLRAGLPRAGLQAVVDHLRPSLDEMEDGCRRPSRCPRPPWMCSTWAASICSQTGWVSREKADTECRMASGDALRSCLFPYSKADNELCQAYRPGPEHAQEAARYSPGRRQIEPGDSEYLANVRRVAEAEWVGERNVAILGSAVASYHREMTARPSVRPGRLASTSAS